MGNLEFYNSLRAVPPEAKKAIQGGRLKGMTDINPMWRIKALTERFGPCGIGWMYVITDKRLSPGSDPEIAAFVDIDLFVKVDGEWSAAIPGTGGSMFVANEKNGPYTSDECFKMALTDAIGVACKALGVAADVYWEKDRTKYDQSREQQPMPKGPPCADCGAEIMPYNDGKTAFTAAQMAERAMNAFGRNLCIRCGKIEGRRLAEEVGAG